MGLNSRSRSPSWIFLFFYCYVFTLVAVNMERAHSDLLDLEFLLIQRLEGLPKTKTPMTTQPTTQHPPATTHHSPPTMVQTCIHTYINYIHNYIPPTTLISILHRSCGRERGPQDSGLFSFATNAFMTSKPWAKKIVACTGLRRPPPNYCNAIIFPSAFSTSMTYLI